MNNMVPVSILGAAIWNQRSTEFMRTKRNLACSEEGICFTVNTDLPPRLDALQISFHFFSKFINENILRNVLLLAHNDF